MKGLDWSNESFVRVVRADTPAWKRLRYEAQSVYLHLLRRLDRAGCMTLDGLLPYEAVAEMTGCPEDTAERAMEKLFKAGFLAVNREADLLYDPEFLVREEAPMSDALRKRESRARRRDRAAESRIVTDPSQNVTEPSRCVTRGHAASHPVTPIPPSSPVLPSEEDPPSPPGGKPASLKAPKKIPKTASKTDLLKLIRIPNELQKIGIGYEELLERIRECPRNKTASAWQKELDRLVPMVAECGRQAVLETWKDATSAPWQGCTPTFVRSWAQKNGGKAVREKPVTDYYKKL